MGQMGRASPEAQLIGYKLLEYARGGRFREHPQLTSISAKADRCAVRCRLSAFRSM